MRETLSFRPIEPLLGLAGIRSKGTLGECAAYQPSLSFMAGRGETHRRPLVAFLDKHIGTHHNI